MSCFNFQFHRLEPFQSTPSTAFLKRLQQPWGNLEVMKETLQNLPFKYQCTWSNQISFKANLQCYTFTRFYYPPENADFLKERMSFLLSEYKPFLVMNHAIQLVTQVLYILFKSLYSVRIKPHTRFFCLHKKTKILIAICIHCALQTYTFVRV